MDEVIRVADQYYILAASSLADERTRVLKSGETFAVFDRQGDIGPVGGNGQGIYNSDTRFLSRSSLRINGDRPLLLSSAVRNDNANLTVDLTNPDIQVDGSVVVPRGALHISRSKFLWQNSCYERICIFNYSLSAVHVAFVLSYEADFADIFEVRGLKRKQRGRPLESRLEDETVVLGYKGTDGVIRETRINCVPRPQEISAGEMKLCASLEPQRQQNYDLTITCQPQSRPLTIPAYEVSRKQAADALQDLRSHRTEITTSNEQFNDWLNRSRADLRIMMTDMPTGLYPYAGVPWFSTAFGRDGILTGLETLWLEPDLSKGVLAYLASTQAEESNPQNDAEPGKILHETRKGEMANTGEVPFGRYYGSVDSTPLFVLLAANYFARTGDLEFIRSIWPNIERALQWIYDYGDIDGDGFVEYQRQSPKGLVQQGWKDSSDSVFHADGALAEPPIALCEVQAYVYGAKRGAALLASAMGEQGRAGTLEAEAESLRQKFEDAFWCEELSTYALALDGKKRACQVRASNAGQCLFTGIASPERARLVAESLLAPDLYSGWGIRTVGENERRYSPMSYHNGCIWPHDNAIIASGFERYGLHAGVATALTGFLDASIFLEFHRLPELFCGFSRRPGEGPTLYPVACAPQAWAAASVFLLLGASLGICIHGQKSRICFAHSRLPEAIQKVWIKNLQVGNGIADLAVERRRDGGIGLEVLRKDGQLEVISIK